MNTIFRLGHLLTTFTRFLNTIFKLISPEHFAFFASALPLFPRPHQAEVFFSPYRLSVNKLLEHSFSIWILPNDETGPNVPRTSTTALLRCIFGVFPSTSCFTFTRRFLSNICSMRAAKNKRINNSCQSGVCYSLICIKIINNPRLRFAWSL